MQVSGCIRSFWAISRIKTLIFLYKTLLIENYRYSNISDISKIFDSESARFVYPATHI